MPIDQFKQLINHHLAQTEWKYASSEDLFPSVAGRPGTQDNLLGQGVHKGMIRPESHPIRVLGRDCTGGDMADEETSGLGIEGIDGLPLRK